MLQVLGLNVWDVGSVLRDVVSWMEKDEDLQKMIWSTHSTYAWQLKMAWDVKNWDQESTKANQKIKLIVVLDFYESRMIHGR